MDEICETQSTPANGAVIQEQKRCRNVGIDLMKLLAMFLIVISHWALSLGVLQPSLNVDQSAFYDMAAASSDPVVITLVFLRGLGSLGNLMFLLCSVWFLTSSTTTKYQKVFQLLLDTFLISASFLIGYLTAGANLSYKEIIKCLLPTLFANNWYVTCYLLLYLVHPLLNLVINHMGKRRTLHTCLILSFLYFVVCTVYNDAYFNSRIVVFLVFYLVVGCLQKWKMDLMDKTSLNIWMVAIGFLGYLALILATEFIGLKFGLFANSQLRYAHNSNIFLIMMALGSFNLFRRIPFKSRFVSYLAKHSLFVYLIHESLLFKTYTRPLIFPWIYSTFGYSHIIGWVFLLSIGLFLTSLLAGVVYSETLGRLTKLVSNKLATIKALRPVEN